METKYYAVGNVPEYYFPKYSVIQVDKIEENPSTIHYNMTSWNYFGGKTTTIPIDDYVISSNINKGNIIEINKKLFDTLNENAEKFKKLIEIQNTTIESLLKNLTENGKEEGYKSDN